jgi:hypothetical protein
MAAQDGLSLFLWVNCPQCISLFVAYWAIIPQTEQIIAEPAGDTSSRRDVWRKNAADQKNLAQLIWKNLAIFPISPTRGNQPES